MGCNTCKKSKTTDKSKIINNATLNNNLLIKIRDNIIKLFVFIFLSVIFIPLVIPATFYTLFITIFTNKGINIVPLALYIGKKIFNDNDDDDDDDDALDWDEYELDSNEITIIK